MLIICIACICAKFIPPGNALSAPLPLMLLPLLLLVLLLLAPAALVFARLAEGSEDFDLDDPPPDPPTPSSF